MKIFAALHLPRGDYIDSYRFVIFSFWHSVVRKENQNKNLKKGVSPIGAGRYREREMAGLSKDDALITVLLRHLEAHRLPVILSIQEKVVRGEVINDWEIGFLEESVEEIRKAIPLVNHHPELQGLYTRSAAMFLEISRKAYQNEESLPAGY